MKYFHKSLYFPNQIFQNGYVTPCYSSCQNGEGLHGCHSSNRFLWLELQSTSFVADQKLPYLDFAGNADPQLQIGDVTIPQFWPHTGLWNWQFQKGFSYCPQSTRGFYLISKNCGKERANASRRVVWWLGDLEGQWRQSILPIFSFLEFWVVGGRSWLLCLT